MDYTNWLIETFPTLKSKSSATTYSYIEKAKKQTQFFRFVVFFLSIIVAVSLGYLCGFLAARYTDINPYTVIGICGGLSIFLFGKIQKKFEKGIIQRKLSTLVKRDLDTAK